MFFPSRSGLDLAEAFRRMDQHRTGEIRSAHEVVISPSYVWQRRENVCNVTRSSGPKESLRPRKRFHYFDSLPG